MYNLLDSADHYTQARIAEANGYWYNTVPADGTICGPVSGDALTKAKADEDGEGHLPST